MVPEPGHCLVPASFLSLSEGQHEEEGALDYSSETGFDLNKVMVGP